jgi:3-hydroxyacyl-CoA dehydrogenase
VTASTRGLREIAPTLEKLGLPVAALEEESPALTFEADAAAAVTVADVVQENAPEHLDIKQELWQESSAPLLRTRCSRRRHRPCRHQRRRRACRRRDA